jgi:serine protease Do/serine protease DegQ
MTSRAKAFPSNFLAVQMAMTALFFSSAGLAQQAAVPTLAPIIERASPAVVNISVSGSISVRNPLAQDPFFRRFFPPEGRRDFQSAGSGVIVNAEEGYILTNHHVVENADQITVTLADNRSVQAEVVGSDRDSDVAVLQVAMDNLSAMPLGNSDELKVGDFVIAIGNPFALAHTVTSGIVSGLGRSNISRDNPSAYEDFIQTDASINPGNSGGALVNLRGELVGINSAILSGTGGNIGIGFAIPVNMARSIMDQIVEFGTVSRGMLGVTIATITPDIAGDYGLRDTSGALVTAVAPGSAAEEAGLAINDIIVSINQQPIRDAAALRNTIGLLRPGERVTVGLIREGRERSVTAVLDEMNGAPGAGAPEEVGALDPVFEGAELVANNETRPDFNGIPGILVTQVLPDSPAALRGLRAGDVITHVNRQPVRDLAGLRSLVDNARSIILQVQRGNRGVLILMR